MGKALPESELNPAKVVNLDLNPPVQARLVKPTPARGFITAVETLLLFFFRLVRIYYSRFYLKDSIKTQPHYRQPLEASLEQSHKDFWAPLGKTNGSWLRYYCHASGIEDARYVPGDLYFSMIEHRLNDADQNDLLNNKNNLDRLYGFGVTPPTVLRCMSGTLVDPEYQIICDAGFSLPAEDLIIKPAFDSHSGQGVEKLVFDGKNHKLKDGVALADVDLADRFGPHFIVQRVITTHRFFSQFNPASVNTLRLYIYRSVKDNRVHVLRTVLRVGVGSTLVDNVSVGGLSCVADDQGKLGEFAMTMAGEKHRRHPVSQVEFSGRLIPHFDRILALASSVGERTPSHRTLGLDITMDGYGKPVLIEVNPMGVGLDFMQLDGGPLFAGFSEEVRDFCAANPGLERKRIIRP